MLSWKSHLNVLPLSAVPRPATGFARLSHAFNTTTGIPKGSVLLSTEDGSANKWGRETSLLAEIGTVQLEFRYLSKHLKKQKYADLVRLSFVLGVCLVLSLPASVGKLVAPCVFPLLHRNTS